MSEESREIIYSTETAYLGCEIAMCDAMGVDILQARYQSWKSP